MKYTDAELRSFCERAIKAINKRYHLELTFNCCWWFENSIGSRLHILYDNPSSHNRKGYEFNHSGNIVTNENEINIDKLAGIKRFFPQETKIILRIAYYIYLDIKHAGVI